MGVVYSYFRDRFLTIKALTRELSALNRVFGDVLERINSDPGLPVPKPTISFWQENPLYPALVNIRSDRLPDTVDVVIIGSGITGASVARTLLRESGQTRKVVMLESRQTCSGATGRNGGHIKPTPYVAFQQMKRRFGPERARVIVKFWVKHVKVLTGLAKAEGINAECRGVETVDLFFHRDVFEKGKEAVRELAVGMPDIAAEIATWEAAEAREVFGLPTPSQNPKAVWYLQV
jgi:glycine/D-amino acid oxidase-like deaminating enzyme